MINRLFVLAFLLLVMNTRAQDFPFAISLRPVADHSAPGLHSFAFGQSNEKWLIVGGRLDGLHARQPMNAFPASSNNTLLRVIDPATGEVWMANNNSLEAGVREQLASTNMCFEQVADTLYIVGGYAYSASSADHITFPRLTTLTVGELIEAIIDGGAIAPHIKSVIDERMAITGGQLAQVPEGLMAVGGHRFDGRYNPMGHNTYVQTYTNAIRSFHVDNTGSSPVISNFTETMDAAHLHRRDYNLVPQVFGDGSFGHMISSGVFQTNVDLPYLYPVEIRTSGHSAITAFNQYLSNYHSAHATLLDTTRQLNHTLFFGGMARYYYQDDELIQDDNVPFVNTISRLTRDENDALEEFALPVSMPSLVGASAEFIPNPNLYMIENEIVGMGDPIVDSLLLGHIYGGIASSSLNPFVGNSTSQTNASAVIYEVWIKSDTETTDIPIVGEHLFSVSAYPNPSNGEVRITITAPQSGTAFVTITDQSGRAVQHFEVRDLRDGKNDLQFLQPGQLAQGTYTATFTFEDVFSAVTTIVIQ